MRRIYYECTVMNDEMELVRMNNHELFQKKVFYRTCFVHSVKRYYKNNIYNLHKIKA